MFEYCVCFYWVYYVMCANTQTKVYVCTHTMANTDRQTHKQRNTPRLTRTCMCRCNHAPADMPVRT